MENAEIILRTAKYVRGKLEGEGSGHDWWHICRVWNMAKKIGEAESANLFVVELAALLHDIADWKFHGGDDTVGPRVAREWLESLSVNKNTISHICEIIQDISFKGAGVATKMKTTEGMVVQDADRLDAIGAIGIGRTFAYGGFKGREMYNPEVSPEEHNTFEQYKNNQSNTVNHFYEKLLLLKDLMNTDTAHGIAEKRHTIMEKFLEEFLNEWNGVS